VTRFQLVFRTADGDQSELRDNSAAGLPLVDGVEVLEDQPGLRRAHRRDRLELLEHHAAPVEQSWFQSVIAAPAVSDSQAILAQASDRLVRDLLDRELTIQQLRVMKDADAQSLENLQRELAERERKIDSVNGKRDTARGSADTGIVLSLQKQLTDRDKKIEELTSQLEALKRIDQEMRDKVRPIHPPSTVVSPPTASEPTTP